MRPPIDSSIDRHLKASCLASVEPGNQVMTGMEITDIIEWIFPLPTSSPTPSILCPLLGGHPLEGIELANSR